MIKIFSSLLMVLALLTAPAIASAHVVVNPAKVNVGEYTTYSAGVPNESKIAITSFKVIIPAGLKEVTPTVKPGWSVMNDTTASALIWTGGSIPTGTRDDFTFSAQAPGKSTDLIWKAYETLEDGSVISWDQKPTASESDSGTKGPYSITHVANDIQSNTAAADNPDNSLPLIISSAALLLSFGTLLFRKQTKN